MSFHTIIISEDTIVFNTTEFDLISSEDLMIDLVLINHNFWEANQNELLISYDLNQATNTPVNTELTGFVPDMTYTLKRDGNLLESIQADTYGLVTFSTGKSGTHRYEIFQQGQQQSNHPPFIPSTPQPAHLSEYISNTPTLSWIGGDPDDDQVTYDIYLGSTQPLTKVSTNQTNTEYNPPSLEYSTAYQWKIISWDEEQMKTTGPIWTFTTEPWINQPPNPPTNPDPAHESNNVDINANLFWQGYDPDGDPLTYDIYFGQSMQPALLMTNHSTSEYSLSTMDFSTTYYWRIISWDPYGDSATSPLWSFTTSSEPNNPPETPQTPSGPTLLSTFQEKYFSTTSNDMDDDQITYVWSWDNDSPYEFSGPYPSGAPCELSHLWEQPGTYQIKVKARDQHYRESSWSEPLEINIYPQLAADAKGPYTGTVNETIFFKGTVQGGIPSYGWIWEMEPLVYATEQDPTYIYQQPGDYPIILTVTDSTGNQSSNTSMVHITPENELSVIIQSNHQARMGEGVILQGRVDGGMPPYQWSWDFDDGTTSTKQNPTHYYDSEGIYTITLTVNDINGHIGQDDLTIQIITDYQDKTPPTFEIKKPRVNSFYLQDQKVLFWPGILILGDLTFEITATDDRSGIDYVEFIINDNIQSSDTNSPFTWTWTTKNQVQNMITIRVIDRSGNIREENLQVWRFF